jgi:hypothetical protein
MSAMVSPTTVGPAEQHVRPEQHVLRAEKLRRAADRAGGAEHRRVGVEPT